MTTETTRHREVPRWLNIDAFDLPAADVTTMQETADEVLTIARRLAELVGQAARSRDALTAALSAGPEHSDDVAQAIGNYTGEQVVFDVLGLIQRLASEFTQSSEPVDPYFEEACTRYGIDITGIDVSELGPSVSVSSDLFARLVHAAPDVLDEVAS